MPGSLNRWAVLRFWFSGPFLELQCSDSLGRRQTFFQEWRPTVSPDEALNYGPKHYPIPYAAASFLSELTEGLAESRIGDVSGGPVPAGLFVTAPRALDGGCGYDLVGRGGSPRPKRARPSRCPTPPPPGRPRP